MNRPRLVVGIGASAGGLDALARFFEHVPRDTRMAFVVVQHLSPDFKSLMDELLARHTALPIHLVEDGMSVEPNHVYLIPSKKEMIISGERLLLSERDRQQELTLPIDVFFRSLAQDCGPRAAAVVLSGGGSDGSRGIRDVHDAGGLVLVQDQATAQFDGMPKAARDLGIADFVLPPEAMPQVLVDHVGRGLGAAQAPGAETGPEAVGIEAVHRMLEDRFGIDFTHYKQTTVTRRIERRLALARSQNIEEYLARLTSDREELDSLYRDLLIGVTHFFRDPQAFELLEQRVLPEIWARSPADAHIRLWVAGCATGEEAYSLAIVAHDVMQRLGERTVKIFATDVHRGSLERAALGIYEESDVVHVSPDRLARYFVRNGSAYQVIPELRQNIVFAQHNVIRDAPFTRVDLITCRNLLIYLQPAVQQRILSFFHFALNQGGALFLGPSETLGPMAHGFQVVDKHWQLYRKHGESRMPVDARQSPIARDGRAGALLPGTVGKPALTHLLSAYDDLLDESLPPSLLVNERGEIVHVFAGASQYLRVPDGRPGLSAAELVQGDLKMILAGALKRAATDANALVFSGIRVREGDDTGCKVTVRRVGQRRGGPAHLLISIEPMEGPPRPAARAETQIDLDQVSRQQLAALEEELGETKQNLQSAIEELETSNEELQASNEELQSSNEELQSTNEELQSVNEELYTVNAEYQRKIAELTELTNDMDNLLASTEVGTIFLDKQLRIRRFTPQVAETFSLVPHDVGRSIETFAHRLDHPELVADLRRVVETGQPIERDPIEVSGRAYFLRILPYRARNVVDGVVLTLIDVSGLKAAEDALFHERYLLNSLLRTVPDAIYFKDARGRFIRANGAMAERLGVSEPSQAVGKTAYDVPNRDIALALQRQDDEVMQSGQPQHYRLEPRRRPDGSDAWDVVTRLPLVDAEQRIVGLIVIFRDVTEQKRAEARIQEAIRRRDQFLAMLSHELRNPLGAIVTATAMLKMAGPLNAEQERIMGVLDRQSRQMAHLLDDLLEASRVTQNKIPLRKTIMDLRSVAREAAEVIRPQMEAQGLQFSAEMDSEPLQVLGDAARLQQVQVNLLNNAAKYTPRGGSVWLQLRRENGDAVVTVRDTGVGIAAGMIDSVFDLFVQSPRTLDRAEGGLGVGLTMVRALVEMHGGTVTVRSDGEGRGSEFAVRLPLSTLATVETTAPRAVKPIPRRGAKVVVVEDNADSREMLCELLRQAGYECHATSSGAAATDLVDKVCPDIVMLDVGLPELDGYEVAKRIRSNPRHARALLIAVTGYGQAADRAASRDAGFDEHLVKPVHPEQLLSLLAAMHGDDRGTS